MANKKIDLSDIKEYDLDKTSSFTDLMSRSERRAHKRAKEQIINEMDKEDNHKSRKKKKENKEEIADTIDDISYDDIDIDNIDLENIEDINLDTDDIEIIDEDGLNTTQLLDITRQMKYNFEETQEENVQNSKKGVTLLNIIGIVNLLCISYYIYLLVFTNYQDNQQNYLITGSIIVVLVLLFGLSTVTGKKVSKIFKILNILAIISFIAFNAYILLK